MTARVKATIIGPIAKVSAVLAHAPEGVEVQLQSMRAPPRQSLYEKQIKESSKAATEAFKKSKLSLPREGTLKSNLLDAIKTGPLTLGEAEHLLGELGYSPTSASPTLTALKREKKVKKNGDGKFVALSLALAFCAFALAPSPAAAYKSVVPTCTESPARVAPGLPLCGSPRDRANDLARTVPSAVWTERSCSPSGRCFTTIFRVYDQRRIHIGPVTED